MWPRDFCTVAALLDGAEVTLRSLRAEDYDAVVALAADLNTEERYLRFFTAHPAHIGEWALSLTSRGKRRLVAEVLCENYAMRRVISDAGWPISQHRDGPILSVEVDLTSVESGYA